MIKYLAEYSDDSGPRINPVEVESETAHFVVVSWKRISKTTARTWGDTRYCDSLEEARHFLARQISKKLELVEAERRKLVEALVAVSKMAE